jgi:hypothetical protein
MKITGNQARNTEKSKKSPRKNPMSGYQYMMHGTMYIPSVNGALEVSVEGAEDVVLGGKV